MADVTKKDEPGTLAKAAQAVQKAVVQPVANALGLGSAPPKAPTKSERKASRKLAVAAHKDALK